MTGPVVTAVETAVYVIPTDAPEADGTLTWDKTTMVVLTVQAGGEQGLAWSYTSAAAQTVVTEDLAGTVIGRDADRLQLDVTRCGGISEFLRGAALAAAHNLQVSGHIEEITYPTSVNGNPANTCVQAGLPAPGALSSSATATRVDSIRDLSTEPRAGDTEIVEDIYED